ncbi:hypothetical protein JP75_06720 [Devosia riboflavina]|uniref:Uncharacterized protein n=1 Tax=Devosia riboflavina TaxID=46914 RepID=A0A087M4E5_9HYPH|nr:hypothetical protein JP75_06720 [Devosia riboflavina]
MLQAPMAAIIGSAVLAALVAAPSGWFARGVVFDRIERPQIEQAATQKANDAATIRVMDAAKRAQDAERERQQRVGAEAARIYREALTNSRRAAEEERSRLEQENADYAAQLALEGRSCVFTGPDLEWLHGLGPPRSD